MLGQAAENAVICRTILVLSLFSIVLEKSIIMFSWQGGNDSVS